MDTIFYLFFKMHLEKLSLVIDEMGKMSEKEGSGKLHVYFLDPLKITSTSIEKFYNQTESPILSCNFSTPGEKYVFSFFMGINGVTICDSKLLNLYSKDLSQDSAAFAFKLFENYCTSVAYEIGRKSIFDKKVYYVNKLDEIEVKTEKNTEDIRKMNVQLSLVNKKLIEFDEKFSKYKVKLYK